MTTITIILFNIGILTIPILGIILLYNVFAILFWMWKNKYDKTNTDYERKKIVQHKKPIYIITPIMIAIGLAIFLYNLSVSFDTLIGNKGITQAISNIHITKRDNGLGDTKNIIEKKDINDIINILNEYKYKKNIQGSRFGNTIVMIGEPPITLDFQVSGRYFKALDVTSGGYIYDLNTGQAYKIISENKKELFDRLVEEISRVK